MLDSCYSYGYISKIVDKCNKIKPLYYNIAENCDCDAVIYNLEPLIEVKK